MNVSFLPRFNFFAGAGSVCLALFLVGALSARAGLTLELHVYTQSQGTGFVFYTPLLTNAIAPAAALGTYVVQSPQWPGNGAQRGYDLTASGLNDRYEFDGEYGYSDLASTMFQITNGTWHIVFTNATTTNIYAFTVSAPAANSNTLPLTIITFPQQGSTILTSQTNFTWQGPQGWASSAFVQTFNDYGYYRSATLPAGQTSWNVDSIFPVQTNNTFNLQYLTTNTFFSSTTPLSTNNSQPISEWDTLSVFESGSSVGFNVALSYAAPSTGHSCFGYYTFEDNNASFPEDFSGNGNNLNAIWFGTPAYITNDAEAGNYAAAFTGSGWFNAPDSLSNLFAGSFSVSLWLKTTNVLGSEYADEYSAYGIVSALGNDYSTGVMPMGQAGNRLAFYTGGSDANIMYSQASITTGQYVHIVTTRDQQTGEKRIYVNGVLDSSVFSDTDFLDGASNSGPSVGYNNGNVFIGEMDEIQFYSGVLSSNEVAYLHGHPGTKVADTIQLNLPVGRYDFEDPNSPETDSSGRNNNIDYYSSGSPADVASTNAAVGMYARQFFGATSYIFTTGGAEFPAISNALTGSFSVTAWVNTTNSVNFDSANAYYGLPILFLYNSNTNSTVPLSITGSKAAFTIYDENGNSVTIHSTTTVNDGHYHLLAVTRDMASGLMSLYVDGNLEATNTSSKSFLQIPWIHLAGGYYVPYQGLLDDVRIYSGVLTPDNVATLAANGGPTFNSALGTSGLTWTTSGDSNWFLENTNTFDGAPYAAQSGSVTNSQSTTLSITVTGPGALNFVWSSIANDPNGGFDFEFYIDDPNTNDIADLYGDNSWETIEQTLGTNGPISIPAGQHTLYWTVYANNDTDPTQAGYLDAVSYVPDIINTNPPAPVVTLNPFNQTNYPGYQVALLAASTSSPAVTWQWFQTGSASPITGATNAFYIPTNSGTAGVAGSYYAVATNINGSANTLTAAVTFASAPLPPNWSVAFRSPLENNNTDATTNYNIACTLDSTGNVYSVGSVTGTNLFGSDYLISINGQSGASILKQTATGTAIWGRCMTNNGNGSSYAQCAAVAPGDGCYVAGNFSGTNWLGTNMLVDTAGSSAFLARFDTSGNLLWVRTISGSGANFISYHRLVSDSAGTVTLSLLVSGTATIGNTNVIVTGQQGLLAQLDANGYVRWMETPSAWPSYLTYQNGRIYGAMGGNTVNYVGGVTNISDRHYALFSLNATNGQGLWVQGFAAQTNVGNPYGLIDDNPVLTVSGTNLFVAGTAWTNAMFGPFSVNFPSPKGQYFARYDTNGNAQIATAFGSQYTWPWSIAADANGNVYVGGDFDTYSIFGNDIIAAPFNTTIQYFGPIDDRIPGQAFVAKLDRNGNPLWAKLADSQASYANSRDVAVASDGVWLCGFFDQFATFDTFTINGSITVVGFPFGTITYHPGAYLAKVAFSTALPVTLLNSQEGGGNFQVSFVSQTGFNHGVQYGTNLMTGANWQTYTNIPGDGTLKTVSIPLSVFSPSQQGYIRVLTQ